MLRQFLIQADFILTANREGLETLSEWNICLRKGITQAFLSAVEHFNLTEGLRYTWPRFLKNEGRCSVRFWSRLRDELLQTLKGEVILQSRYGNEHFSSPDELLYIPPEFRLGGEPLVENAKTRKKHLSFHYDSDSLPELAEIGVKVMGYRGFFRELKS